MEVVSDDEANALAGFSSGLDSLLTTTTDVNELADYVWTFDSAFTGLMTQMTTSDGVVEYSYDSRGQLTGATYDYQDDESYSYDANGNRTGDGYVVGDYNRLLSDGTYNYEYDAEGNRIKRTTIATGEVTEYVWDNRNRLVAVIDRLSDGGPIVQSVEYVYDSQNRWIGKSVDTDGDGPEEPIDTYFVYDDDQIILQIDGEGEVTNRYLWGPAVDQILADEQVQEDGSTEVLWTLTDHQNTVRDLAVYDADTGISTVVNHIVYDAYGQVTSQTDPTVGTLFGFTGRAFDADTGLQNNLNRWYDVETGTWISEDPTGFAAGDANLYRYVGNQVTTASDPTGLSTFMPPGARDGEYMTLSDWAYIFQGACHAVVDSIGDTLEGMQFHSPSQGMGGFLEGGPSKEQREAARELVEPLHDVAENISGTPHDDPDMQAAETAAKVFAASASFVIGVTSAFGSMGAATHVDDVVEGLSDAERAIASSHRRVTAAERNISGLKRRLEIDLEKADDWGWTEEMKKYLKDRCEEEVARWEREREFWWQRIDDHLDDMNEAADQEYTDVE